MYFPASGKKMLEYSYPPLSPAVRAFHVYRVFSSFISAACRSLANAANLQNICFGAINTYICKKKQGSR